MKNISIILTSFLLSVSFCFAHGEQIIPMISGAIGIFILLPLFFLKWAYNRHRLRKNYSGFLQYLIIKDIVLVVLFSYIAMMRTTAFVFFTVVIVGSLIVEVLFYILLNTKSKIELTKKTITYFILSYIITLTLYSITSLNLSYMKNHDNYERIGDVVYCNDKKIDTIGEFRELDGIRYGIDSKNVYYCDRNDSRFMGDYEILQQADPKTFTQEYWFGKDNKFVYWKNKQLYNADANTFEVYGYYIGKDKNNVYCGDKVLEGIDSKSLEYPKKGAINDRYIKDKNGVRYVSGYYCDSIFQITGADVATFSVSEEYYDLATDKNHNYDGGLIVQ